MYSTKFNNLIFPILNNLLVPYIHIKSLKLIIESDKISKKYRMHNFILNSMLSAIEIKTTINHILIFTVRFISF